MEAEGLTLHLSAKSKTGYLHVTERAIVRAPPRFQAQVQSAVLGTHDTAVEAAVAVAKYLKARGQEEEEEAAEVEEEEAAAAEEEEEAAAVAAEEAVEAMAAGPPRRRRRRSWARRCAQRPLS